jgi:hypothetical protein
MIEAFSSRTGAPTVRIDGVALHSPYDPVREADRFVASAIGPEPPSTILVLGEGLGYVSQAAVRLHPRARVLSVSYSGDLPTGAGTGSVASWSPGSTGTIGDFLRARLGELDIEGLRVVEWPPSARIFAALSLTANEAVRQVVQELNGSFAASVGLGRSWIRNSVANFLALGGYLTGSLCDPARPILIVAPGPSLEQSARCLVENRARFELWALPSSCAFLRDAGLGPDLVVMTDPGFYAVHHLHFAPPGCPIAMPLSAARGTWDLQGKGVRGAYLIAQPVAFEQALLAAAGIDAPLLAPHGTVAATALDLALRSTAGPVIFAGLDMCMRDVLSHARPNAFDALLMAVSGRLAPHEGLCHGRAAAQHAERLPGAPGYRISPPLKTYAGWFHAAAGSGTGRVFRLLSSPVAMAGMIDIRPDGLGSLLDGLPSTSPGCGLRPASPYPSDSVRTAIVRRLLDGWAGGLAGLQADLERPGWEAALSGSPEAFSLASTIAPRQLVEARRRDRLGDAEGSVAARAAMLAECVGFLRRLGGRSADAA